MDTRKILIIDDDPTICELIVTNLKQNGYTTVAAFSGETGIEAAKKDTPDCIILDWSLPGMDGMEVLKSLKEDDATQNIPVIMLTAKTEISHVSQSLSYGAKDFIVKPFEHDNLIERLEKVLSH